MRDHLTAVCQKKEGARRIAGDRLLPFVASVLDKEPEDAGVLEREQHTYWIEAGLDLTTKPSHGTVWNRFTELEKPEILAKINEIADRLIRNARTHDPEHAGRSVGGRRWCVLRLTRGLRELCTGAGLVEGA